MSELTLEVLGWWLAIAVLASLLSACAYPVVRLWMARLPPSMRSTLRLVYTASAPLAALLAVVLVTHPTTVAFLIPQHCHGSDCGSHTPVYAGGSLIVIGLASVCSLIVLLLLTALTWAVLRGRRRLRLLSGFARNSGKGYRTLDSTDVLVCCVGLLRPEILCSQGLLEQLQPDELAIVLAHERAHVERMDNLKALLLRWMSVFWPVSLRQQLHQDSRADAEQACDLAAARTVAAPGRVAAVIRKLSLLSPGTVRSKGHSGVGFDRGDASARISALESGVNPVAPSLGGWCKVVACLSLSGWLQIYLLTVVSHLMIEWLGTVAS